MKRICGFIVLSVLSFTSFAQIQTNEFPPNFRLSQKLAVENITSIPAPNVTNLLLEDAKDEAQSNKPWRFGTLIPVNYTLQNAGNWTTNDNLGTEVWTLTLASSGAKSLNLNFNDFHLNEDAKLFIYTDKKNVIGAITAANNKIDRLFSTRPLHGDKITLELHVPQNKKNGNVIAIEGLVYGYKDFQDKVNKVFQSSGNCNVNVNCSQGDNWTDQRRSVAMITTSANTRFCTGALVNNVRQDTTPYFLTASHCGVRNNSVFIFGYQSPNCSPNTDGQLTNSISGSTRRAVTITNSVTTNTNSDFELRELSVRPPASFNVFYSGWSAVNTPAQNSTCIHHPAGDVMKISMDNDAATTSGYYTTGTTHWQVTNWESGTTEGGSSGSPMFDQNQRIVGQLHGGDASCFNNLQDYFGKFSHSWDHSSNAANQLKNWLDPDSTGTLILDGLDPTPAAFANDLHLFDILGIDEDYECASSIQPSVLVRNVGNATVNSFSIQYSLGNGNTQVQNVSTSLARNQIEEVVLPSMNLPFGDVTFRAQVSFNAPQSDGNPSNNIDSVSTFANTASNPEFIIVELKTDDYGSETSWNVTDRNRNAILAQGGGYTNVSGGQVFIDTFCIHNACYDFNLFDSQGDGFDGSFGNGYLLVINSLNDTLINIPTFTGSTLSDTFCITTNVTSIAEINSNKVTINVFPNPVTRGQSLHVSDTENYQFRLYDVQGKLISEVYNQSSIEISNDVKAGLYILEVIDNTNQLKVATKKVLVQ